MLWKWWRGHSLCLHSASSRTREPTLAGPPHTRPTEHALTISGRLEGERGTYLETRDGGGLSEVEEAADQLESSWHSTQLGLGETLVHTLSDVPQVPV